jgi:hypothetical protein
MLSVVLAPSDRTQKLLEAARQKLVRADSPLLLRMTTFLRLSCLTLDEPGAYSQLMQKLCSHKEWWLTCEVTLDGTLRSSHPDITLALAPIHRLYHPQALPLAA